MELPHTKILKLNKNYYTLPCFVAPINEERTINKY